MKKLLSWPVIINAGLFQIVWFACVLGAANEMIWPALVACAVLAIWQLHSDRRHPTDFKLICVAIILGLLIYTLWVQAGLLSYKAPWPWQSIAPIWIILLWLGFALTINHSLAWLSTHPLLPAAMGLVGGPMSYLAGLKLGAVEYLANTILISVCLGLAWALSLVIMVKFSQIIEQQQDNEHLDDHSDPPLKVS